MNILVVDDEKSVRLLLRKILEKSDFTVYEADNSESTFNLLKAEEIDLIILDIHLGQDNGYNICRAIKEITQFNDIPIIFLTASEKENALNDAYQAGGVDFVQKPIDSGSLLMRIHSHMAHVQTKKKLREQHEELKTYQAFIIQNEKHNAITRMVGGISHEMNNPLCCIKSNFSALKKYIDRIDHELDTFTKKNELITKELRNCKEVLQETVEEFNSLNRITEKLLTLDLPENELQLYSIKDATDTAMTFLADKVNKQRIKIHLEESSQIECNPALFTDCLFNILDNALDATNDSLNPKISLKSHSDQTHLYISISDNGYGIKEDIISKVFDPFFTTKGTGAGIGLTNAQHTIQNIGGSISAHSTVGSGTQFRITIPKIKRPPNKEAF